MSSQPTANNKSVNQNHTQNTQQSTTRHASHCGLAIYIKKYLKAKEEELWKFKYFTMQKYNLQKNSSKKETKSLQHFIINSIITNLKFQHKPKYHLSKILI
jgi:hypothetical protein